MQGDEFIKNGSYFINPINNVQVDNVDEGD